MNHQRALPASRRDYLVSVVNSQGAVRVAEVARALGVSPITVRRDIALLAEEGLMSQVRGGAVALNGQGEEINRREFKIGVVTPTLDVYWPAVIAGANEAADELGARLVLQGSTFDARDNLVEVKTMAKDLGIDGLLLVPDLEGRNSAELVSYLQDLDMPTVFMERDLRPGNGYYRSFNSVKTDHFSGGQLAVRHLAELGHKRIGLLTDKFIPSRHGIKDGWQTTLVDEKLDADSPICDTTALSGVERSKAIEDFTQACMQDGTTALIVHSDEAAVLALEHLVAAGVKVPDEMSIVTYDDELANLTRPALTAIAPAKEAMGKYAVEILMTRLLEEDAPKVRLELEPRLVVRDSTARPRA